MWHATNHGKTPDTVEKIAMASSDLLLSQSEQNFIRTGCTSNCRGDGRTATEFRRSTITVPGPIPLSHGSARLITSDGLQMLCSVKAELVAPSLHQPRQGSIVVSIDQHGATNRSQLREHQVALQQRLQWVDDLTKLCVIPGAAAWRLHVDLFIVSSSKFNSTASVWPLDAASHCIRHALANTVLPAIEIADETMKDNGNSSSSTNKTSVLDRLVVNSDIAMAKPVVTSESVPFLVTVHIVPSSGSSSSVCLILDATPEEQAVAVAAVHVAVVASLSIGSNEKAVTAVWKSGAGSVPVHLLPTVVQTALDAVEPAQQSYQKVVLTDSNESNGGRQWLQTPLLIQ